MPSDGTPLPPALSGNIIERLIRIDEALIYLVSGSLSYLVNREPLEQTGALTPETAKNALSDMFTAYFEELPAMIPIGGLMPFGGATAPEKWLLCDGAEISRADYADLFAQIGTAYGAGNGTTTFNLPDMRGRSTMGVDGALVSGLGAQAGASAVALSIANLPSHDHDYTDPGHTHGLTSPFTSIIGARPAGGAAAAAGSTISGGAAIASNTTGITFHAQGSNSPHPNVHPVLGVNYIIYAGV